MDDKKILLGMSKSEVVSLLGNADIWENCYYCFDSDLAIDFEEMKADGEYDQDYVDSELELARHWATIGMGRPNYYG